MLISSQFYRVHEFPVTALGHFFALTHSIGHMGLLLCVFTVPLFLFSLLNRALTTQKVLIAVYATLGITLLIVDTFVYRQYRFHLNTMVIELFIAGGSEVISFPATMWLNIIATIIGVFVLQLGLLYLSTKLVLIVKPFTKYMLAVIFICLFSANAIHVWADGMYIKDVTKQSKYLPVAYPATAKTLMAKYGLLDVERYKQQSLLKVRNQSGGFSYPKATTYQGKLNDKPNVLWIIIDAWRIDTLTDNNMPNTFSFAQKSIQYTNHYSGSNNTRHGMFSLFYGLPGSYWDDILEGNIAPVLYKAFQSNNYQTQVYASAQLTMPEFDQTLFSSITSLRTHSKGNKPWQRDVDAVNGFIDNYQSELPYFNVLFLDAAHGFSHPSDYPQIFQPTLQEPNFMALTPNYDRTPFYNLYRNSLHFIDHQLARVFQTIDKDLDNTIVVITGDHSTEFNDGNLGYWGHNSNFSPFQTQVPLLIHWPNRSAKKISRLTSHVDIVPTFFKELFRLPTSVEHYSTGYSLFDDKLLRKSIVMGRKGYYAINDSEYLYELDRLGNFTIYNQQYQVAVNASPNIVEIQKALHQMSRFYH